ncbi:MAG: NUDIX domain-containing protein [Phycisphaeraceae bacterium]
MADEIIEIIARGVLREGDRILLCRNRKHGHLFLPGGHVDFGEPARDALAREIREELGVTLEAGPLVGVCESSFIQKSKRHHEINLVFELAQSAGTTAPLPELVSQEGHIEFLWAILSDLKGSTPTMTLLPRAIVALITTDSEVPFVSDW